MTKKYKKEENLTKQPIQVLHNNIINFFENTHEYSFKIHENYVSEGKISPAILFYNGNEKIRFPFANLEIKEITIQETHLSHLWSFIYSIFVIYEEAIQKKMIDNTFDGSIDLSSQLLSRAEKLLYWSMSLKKTYSDWDISLPNPKKHNYDDEKFYAEKVNNLYQSAVIFLLYHEQAHLVNGHKSYFLGFNTTTSFERIELEKEADEFAFSMLINEENESSKIEKGLAIIMLFSSALLLSNVSSLKQQKHPDIDQRLMTMINKLNFYEKENEFYIWYLGCYILNMYLKKSGIDYQAEISDTHQELFFKYLEKLDEIKQDI
jgi:hypothetical protein